MRASLIRARLRQGQVVRIAALYYPNAMMPAHAAQAGFDALWLDAEHNTWERREIQRLVAMHHLANIDCLVRTGSRNANELYHLLEDGVTALMIPLVNTAADAAALAAAVKFPPLGQRGLDGASLDNHFYTKGTERYTEQANAETFLIVQIETPEALANLDAIAATPGVDGLFLGPGDLALRLGCPADWNHPQMKHAEDAVAAAAARNRIEWGRPAGTVQQIAHVAAKGGKLIAHGSDFAAVMTMLPVYAKNLTEALGSK
jgi:2-keto-3-deoxy-L-rhamnonate aldolase RhmA